MSEFFLLYRVTFVIILPITACIRVVDAAPYEQAGFLLDDAEWRTDGVAAQVDLIRRERSKPGSCRFEGAYQVFDRIFM